jgi:regulator of replication initiation timing
MEPTCQANEPFSVPGKDLSAPSTASDLEIPCLQEKIATLQAQLSDALDENTALLDELAHKDGRLNEQSAKCSMYQLENEDLPRLLAENKPYTQSTYSNRSTPPYQSLLE